MRRAKKLSESYQEIARRLPTCQHSVGEEARESRARLGRPRKDEICGNTARYRLRGKCYCGKHAGTVALEILLRE